MAECDLVCVLCQGLDCDDFFTMTEFGLVYFSSDGLDIDVLQPDAT